MNDEDVTTYLLDLAKRTAFELWAVARRRPTSSRLVLPNYRSGVVRLSEQEARSIAQRVITEGPFWYSIETPTTDRHNFTGRENSIGRSAQHDISLYSTPDPGSAVAHVEFKQGHGSGETGVQLIAKDLKKLITSRRHSLWFHVFPRPSTNEFSKLQGFFREALVRVLASVPSPDDVSVVLAFCAVAEPALWVAGPHRWGRLEELLDGFPIVNAIPHSEWTSVPLPAPTPAPTLPVEVPDAGTPIDRILSVAAELSPTEYANLIKRLETNLSERRP